MLRTLRNFQEHWKSWIEAEPSVTACTTLFSKTRSSMVSQRQLYKNIELMCMSGSMPIKMHPWTSLSLGVCAVVVSTVVGIIEVFIAPRAKHPFHFTREKRESRILQGIPFPPKCRLVNQKSVWKSILCPGMAADIRIHIEKCELCAHTGPQQQKDATAATGCTHQCMEHCICIYLQHGKIRTFWWTVEALSGYVVSLSTSTATETIQNICIQMHIYAYICAYICQVISSRQLVTGSGPQFSFTEFRSFAEQWRWNTAHHPPPNHHEEGRDDSTDVYTTIPDYRNTLHATTGLSSVQVPIRRKSHRFIATASPDITSWSPNPTGQENHQRQVKKHQDKTTGEQKPLRCGDKMWLKKGRSNWEVWLRGQIPIDDKGRSNHVTEKGQILSERKWKLVFLCVAFVLSSFMASISPEKLRRPLPLE